jgi:integrase
MPLTDLKARNAKPTSKLYRLADEKGMYLEVTPTKAKYWRLKYRLGGKEKRLALGVYPEVTLAAARAKRDDARRQLASGVDPAVHRRLTKHLAATAAADSFEAVAREWHAKQAPAWVPSHGDRILRRLERDIFPYLGSRPTGQIDAPELLPVLRRIESRGAVETAHRALHNCSQVFRYAIVTGRAKRDPAQDLRGALAPVVERHHASIKEPKAIGQLMRAITGYQGTPVARAALRLAPLVFVRPGELRKTEWTELDVEALLGNSTDAEWRIPAARMKMREQHIVPLSAQSAALFRELHAITGAGRYVFPGARSNKRPMSENTVNAALRRLGYGKDDMTGHGFRSMASTLLNEQGWNRDAIERQLAHAERDNVRGAYNFAEYLPERRRMMQAWADYLDQLTVGAPVVKLRA